MTQFKPLVLIILDGFGISLEKEGNPVFEAKKATFDSLERNYPFLTLQASGGAVGLPWGEAGNSEVGHLTIGAGRRLYHHLPRIIHSIYDGNFFKNQAFLKAADHVKKYHSRLHIAGLVSSGSVHSYIDHFYALLEFAAKENIAEIYLHIFTDGKDAPPKKSAEFLKSVETKIQKILPQAKSATVIGRFYAMDRDGKWERTRATYELMTEGKGDKITSIPQYIASSYEKGITDEFIKPAAVVNQNGIAEGTIKDNDALIFFNFREDSMRQLARAFAEEKFHEFPRKTISNLCIVTMTEYLKDIKALPAFSSLTINYPLAQVLGEAGMRHLHIAETQKYAHVTYFLNGGEEKLFPGEERILIPSLSGHPDENPQMRAPEITAKILENLARYDVIIANFANADLVGHSGNFQAAVKAVEILDEAIDKLMTKILKTDGVLVITADHGNIELKRNKISGEKLTEHSLNPVPFYVVAESFKLPIPRTELEIIEIKTNTSGMLTDVAPTILKLLNLKKPLEMTGKNLLDI